MLRACGFDDAAVLNGGWLKWTAEKRAVSAERVSFPRTRFTVRPRPELFVTRDDVLDALRAGDKTIVNALSPEEHSGRLARLPRPGRIAGSTNVYYQALLDPKTHAFLPVPALRKLFQDAGVTNEKPVITYCGGGIAASSDALALTLIGANAAVYDGSLVEWTADPSLPMETDDPAELRR
jgi:thiosulfate/3-mercaptopyruvate sulfurtransferase